MAVINVANAEIVKTDQYFANTVSVTVPIKKDLVQDGLLDYGFVDPTFRYSVVSS